MQDGDFVPIGEGDDSVIQKIDLPNGMMVNPKHLGTYYEFRVIDGVLDSTHKLD